MALKVSNYQDALQNPYRHNVIKITIKVRGRRKEISGIALPHRFLDDDGSVPEGKGYYYCRHSERYIGKIISVKRDLGLTVNFWGSIITDEKIDFKDKDELRITVHDEDGVLVNYD